MIRKKHELMVEGDSNGKGQQDLDLAIVVLVRGTKSSRLARERRGRRNEAEVGSGMASHRVPRHFVYRHFVYYCIPGYSTFIHPTSVSANHYFHQFQLLLTLIPFINPTSTDTMIIQHIQLASIVA